MNQLQNHRQSIVGMPAYDCVVVYALSALRRLRWNRLARERLTRKARPAREEWRSGTDGLKLLWVEIDDTLVLLLDANDRVKLRIGDAVQGQRAVVHEDNPVIEFGARSRRAGLLLYAIAGFPKQSEKKSIEIS